MFKGLTCCCCAIYVLIECTWWLENGFIVCLYAFHAMIKIMILTYHMSYPQIITIWTKCYMLPLRLNDFHAIAIMVSMRLLWIVYVVEMPMILEYEIYDLIISISIHDRYYDDHVLHEIPHSCIMDFYWWSCTQEIQVVSVSFHRVLGVLVPKNYSCVPRALSCCHDIPSQAMFHRIQSVMWLKKSQKSHDLSQCQISVAFRQSTESRKLSSCTV